ncbi:MAG: PQQ-binding-like beta-propeller repeat protein [Actinobacteria bacterium]|uniref:Unannotated protein n=1 Tax=freshwater metagenome TaxID=449393 RepID=A0A6J7E879_9ZZZZ|nr:PQQ-binding-like beta-propeller repeat protein [Actinomycetota bacterium]
MDGHDNPNFKRRRILFGAASLGLALIAVVAWLTLRDPGDVSNTKATFTTTTTKPVAPTDVKWPLYGYDAARTKWFRTSAKLGPPYHRMWSYRGKKVLEFSPVVGPTGLYLLDNGATVRRINKETGKQIWRRGLGSLAASSPALPGDGRVYAVTLLTSPGSGHGSATAMNAITGKTIWSRQLPSRAESSPLISGNRMIFGTEDGTVFCLNKANGHTVWTYSAGGSVKAALALSSGRLYFGDYSGTIQAISLKSGKRIWARSAGGRFYSTPAVAWGRIYEGSTDGRMYSYTTSGELAWARQTGNYVYSSPAVADIPGIGPTVFAGSYDGTFYAWSAKTGSTTWTYPAGGKISGGAFVIGNLVWFSDLGNKRVVALRASSGKWVFQIGTGAFSPAVTDGRNMYLVGYGDMFGLRPVHNKK